MDSLKILQDLYEKEVELREASRKYIDTLLLAYDNTVHINERELLAAEILDAMRTRPSHENQIHQSGEKLSYFCASYDMLIAKFISKERLVSQMVHMQVQAERRVIAEPLQQNMSSSGTTVTQNRSRVASSLPSSSSELSTPFSLSSDLASVLKCR